MNEVNDRKWMKMELENQEVQRISKEEVRATLKRKETGDIERSRSEGRGPLNKSV